MNDRHADRLLWRYEFGTVAPEVLDMELRDRLQRVRDDSIAIRDSAVVRLWDDALLSAYDAAIHAAARALDVGQFRVALRQIHRCERVILSMRALVQASDDIERAAAAIEQIHELAETRRLRRLPTVASLGQIVDLARQCIIERRHLQGSHMAAICVRLAEALRERSLVSVEERTALDDRIEAIRDLCVVTQSFVQRVADEPTHDGTLAAVQGLFARQYVVLGARLLTELEVQLAGRRRFLLFLRRKGPGGTAALDAPEEVRTLVRERSWDGAVDHYWHVSIASHASALDEQLQSADRVAARIRAAITPQEAANE